MRTCNLRSGSSWLLGLKLLYLLISVPNYTVASTTPSTTSPCINGVTLDVNASTGVQYILSENFLASGETIVSEDNFVSTDGSSSLTSFLVAYQSKVGSTYPTQVPYDGEDCTYSITAPADHHVRLSFMILGLTTGRGGACTSSGGYVDLDGVGDGFPNFGNGSYCGQAPLEPSETPIGVLSFSPAAGLAYKSTFYAGQLVSTCSSQQQLNMTVNTATSFPTSVGFVVAIRAVKGRYCGLCQTVGGQTCQFDSGFYEYFSDTTMQCSTSIPGTTQPSCYTDIDGTSFDECSSIDSECDRECIGTVTGASCITDFTFNNFPFQGCVKESTLGLSNSDTYVCPTEHNSTSEEHFNFQPCSDTDDLCSISLVLGCFKGPCENGGTCTSQGEQYSCDCTSTGFLGQNCTVPSPCEPNPCSNFATCAVTGTEEQGFDFSCTCSSSAFIGNLCQFNNPCEPNPCGDGICSNVGDDTNGYTASCDCSSTPEATLGQQCEFDNPCEPNPCTGGTCSNVGDDTNGYTASCDCSSTPEATLGQQCQFDDPCDPNPCNSGTCSRTGNDNTGYTAACDCPTGVSGDFCEIEDICSLDPCKNGATCSSDLGTYQCHCVAPWMGQNCTIIDQCRAQDPCKNNAFCFTQSNGSYFCQCVNNWAGENCTQHPDVLVQCGTSSMLVAIEKVVVTQLLEPGEQLHLIDPECLFSDNGTHLVREVSYQGCSTAVFMESASNVEFCQQVTASTPDGEYLSGVTALVVCELQAKGTVVSFEPSLQSNALEAVYQVDLFPLEIRSYNASATSSNFELVNSPVEVETNTPIYMSVATTAFHQNTILILENCWATKDNTASSQQRYTLVQDFCPVDTTLEITAEADKEVFFQFLSFRFVDENNVNDPNYNSIVYIHCSAYLCQQDAEGCVGTIQLCQESSSRRSRRHVPGLPSETKSRTLVASFGPVVAKMPPYSYFEIERDDPNARYGKNFEAALKVYRYYLNDTVLYILLLMTLTVVIVAFVLPNIDPANTLRQYARLVGGNA